MDIKNFLHQKKENKKKKLMFWTIIFIVIIFVILLFHFIKKDQKKISYNIWDEISIQWEIKIDNNYPISTHKISNEHISFGLKSSKINLNNFLDKDLTINWEITEISLKMPILNISNIKIPESKLIINENKYFFTNELILFDFSKDIDIKAQREWKNIVIYYQNEPMVFLETFVCSKITPTQNCEEMILTYTKNLNEMFNTFLGYIFYKNKENSWITFNENTIWYIFKTENNEFLLNISHLINIVNSKFILENKKDLIFNNCQNNYLSWFNNINKVSKEIIDNNLIKTNIELTNDKKEKINCKLTIDIREDWEVKNKNLEFLE
jgi:hypothetical protein